MPSCTRRSRKWPGYLPQTLAHHLNVTQIFCALAILAYAGANRMFGPLQLFVSLACAVYATWRLSRIELDFSAEKRAGLNLNLLGALLLTGFSQIILIDTFLHAMRLPLLILGEGHPVFE